MPYIFDGYNLYHALRKLSEELQNITSRQMCELIAQDMAGVRDKATVVFDGFPLKGQFDHDTMIGSVGILHSRSQPDADTVIEAFIKDNTAPRRLTVVSSDRRIKQAARRRRAVSLTSQEYIEQLFKRLSKPPRGPSEPSEKQRGVGPGQLDAWMDLFGIDNSEDPPPGDDFLDDIQY